jgi:hypothetical protein
VPLHLQELKSLDPSIFVKAFEPVPFKEAVDSLGRAIKDDFNIAISGLPNIPKYLFSFFLKDQAEFIPQKIKSSP